MPALESSLLFIAFGCLLSLLLVRAPLDVWSPATAASALPLYAHSAFSHAYPPAAPPSAQTAPGAMAPYQPPYAYPPAAGRLQPHPSASVSSFLVLLIATAIMGWLSWTTVWPESSARTAGPPEVTGTAESPGSKEDEGQPTAVPAAAVGTADPRHAAAESSPAISSVAASAASVTSPPATSRHSSGKGQESNTPAQTQLPSLARPSSPDSEALRPSAPERPEEAQSRIEALAAALPLPDVVRNVVEVLSKPLKEGKTAEGSNSAVDGKLEGDSRGEAATKKQAGGKNGNGAKNGGGKGKTSENFTPQQQSSPTPEDIISEPPPAMPERSSSAVAELAAQRGSTAQPSAELLERATQELVAKHPELARAGAAEVKDALDSIFLEAKRPASTTKSSPSGAVDPLLQAIESLRSLAAGTTKATSVDTKGVAREVKGILKKSVHFPGDRPRKEEAAPAPASPPGDAALQRIAELARRLNSS